jgi:hypothetical protein
MDCKRNSKESKSKNSNKSGSKQKVICANSARNQSKQKASNPVKGLTLTLYRISS